MGDFTLSGFPIGNAGEFSLEAEQQLTGAFTLQLTIGDGVGSELLVAQATANMSGLVTTTIIGVITGTSNLVVQGGVILAASIPAGFFPYAQAELVSGQAIFDGNLSNNDGTNDFGEWHPFPIYAAGEVTGGFVVDARIGSSALARELIAQASANMTGSPQVDQFIGIADVSGNELLSAAATANMTGQPDLLKDGGSPPFVILNGTDQYLSHPVVTDSDLRGGANFSCVIVFDPEVVEQGGTGVLCGKHDPNATTADWGWRALWDATTGEITVTVSSSSTGADRAERTTAVGGTGIRVRTVFAFTWDSTTLSLYVAGSASQGVQTNFGIVGVMVASTARFAVGADDTLSTPANFFQGAIHAIYIFDDVLSGAEVGTIDQSGYIPSALDDANFVVAWRPDRIEGSTVGFQVTKWLDEKANRQLDRSDGTIVCFPGFLDHLRFLSDEWDMDFLNAQIAGVSLGQNLASDFVLSASTTNFVESGGFRLFVPVTGTAEPEIVSGFRTNANDITVFWGGRKDDASANDVVYFELLAQGLQVFFDAATLDLFVYQDTGTTTRYEFGQSVPGMETTVPDGPGTVFAIRYNSQTALFTLFINGVKMFEEGTTVTGPNLVGSGMRFCEFGNWAAINASASQTDRRAAFVLPSCLPDILMERVLAGVISPVFGMDNASPIGRTLRAALRRNPVPSLPFGLNFFEYDAIDAADDDPPNPQPDRLRPYPTGSGTVEILGQPLDGEQFTLSDGTTTLTFEIEIAGGITGDVSVFLGANVLGTLVNIATAINISALRLTAGAPVVFQPDGANDRGYVRITQDDLHDGDLPLAVVNTSHLIVGGQVRVTGPYRVDGPSGSVGLVDGQPNDGDQFVISDGINTVTFEFDTAGGVAVGSTAVPIGATMTLTMDNLVTAINASVLLLTADPTQAFNRFEITAIDAVQSILTARRSSNPTDYANRVDRPIIIPVNASGNLVASTNFAQPAPFEESIASGLGGLVYGTVNTDTTLTFVDNPYSVLEPEALTVGVGTLPPFINPTPSISSVTADLAKNVTAVALAGPTDAGDVRSWWEIELVSDDPQFNLRIDEQDNNFSINKIQSDTFSIPLGQDWDDLRIRFVIQSQLDPNQLWFSLYVRMTGENFNNGTVETIILPGVGAPEPPPTIELEISTTQQAFVVQEASAAAARQLALSNRSRYKLTRLFVNAKTDPRIVGRNEDGLEFGLLSVLDDFLALGTDVRTYKVRSGDIGFLDQISVKFYGAGFEDFWWVIAYANGIADPDADMFVGQNLVIPPRETVTAFLSRKPTGDGR